MLEEANTVKDVWTVQKSRRRILGLAGGAGLSMVSGRMERIWAGARPQEQDIRMVEGELKSWRSDPRLKSLEVAFRFLERPDLKELPVGRIVINESAYAMVDKVPSQAPEKVQFEAHRKYTDVHYVVSGQATTGFAPIEKLKLITPYDEKDDAAAYAVPASYTKVKLYPGRFAVFFPGGGHMPWCHLDGPHEIHRVVVKVQHDYGTKPAKKS